MRLATYFLGVLLVSDLVWAQDIAPKPFTHRGIEIYDLPTSSNGIAYRLYVRKPIVPSDESRATYFYFLDPLDLFVPASAMTSNYEYFNYIPAGFFIGVGYQDEQEGIVKKHNRTRDYTPTRFAPQDESHFLYHSPEDYEGSGGADDFARVLMEELIPFVEARFGEAEERVLIGKSLSGLAAIHLLLTKPKMFSKYLIVSASLWWDDYFDPRSQRYLHQQIESSSPIYSQETRVYLAVGADEERFGLVTDHYVLANHLQGKRHTNLKVHLEVLEDEIHEGIFPGAFMRGLLALYAEEEGMRKSATRVRWD